MARGPMPTGTTKKNVCVYVETALIEKARAMNLNVSKLVNTALEAAVGNWDPKKEQAELQHRLLVLEDLLSQGKKFYEHFEEEWTSGRYKYAPDSWPRDMWLAVQHERVWGKTDPGIVLSAYRHGRELAGYKHDEETWDMMTRTYLRKWMNVRNRY